MRSGKPIPEFVIPGMDHLSPATRQQEIDGIDMKFRADNPFIVFAFF
jgi:hypothetical protein